MIRFERYPHVRSLIEHYARERENAEIVGLLDSGVTTENEAFAFSRFVVETVDCIANDMQNKKAVLGSTDNTSAIPDIDYEVSLYLATQGFEYVWDKVCDES